MNRFLLLLFSTTLLLTGCTKFCGENKTESLKGNWKMISVKDNVTGESDIKPSSATGDVIISFNAGNTNGGTFSGKTPSNVFGPNSYQLGADQSISMPDLVMTKVAETPWGILFVDNIRTAQYYSMEPGSILSIKTVAKVLTFSKL